MIDDRTPLGIKLPHSENDPYVVDIPRIREALTLVDTLIAAMQGTVSAVPGNVQAALAAFVGAAPALLDTFDEIAAAIGDNPNFAAEIMTLLGQKATKAELADNVATLQAAIGGRASLASLNAANSEIEALKTKVAGLETQLATVKPNMIAFAIAL